MVKNSTSYSPHIQIYLNVEGRKIRLSDVLFQTATLFEQATVPPKTNALLVFSIDGVEETEEVFLENGISQEDTSIAFSYADPTRLNGRNHLDLL